MNQKTAVDIFSGAGGMSIGAVMAGITPILAVEFDKYAADTYKTNHPKTKVLQNDIKTVTPLEHVKKHPFILFGGPPCQGFSVANTKTRNLDNPNNWMFQEYLRFVKDLEPKWFLFENVVGFKSFNQGKFAIEVEEELKGLGYETNSAVLNASDFGVPQDRKRFFIVGHRIDSGGIKFNFDELPKTKNKVTVGDALKDLPSLVNGDKIEKAHYVKEANNQYVKLMRHKSKHALQNFVTENKSHIIERYKVIKQGENWQAAKNSGLLKTYSSTKYTHSGIYKRLEENKPAVTIANYRKSMLIHPNEDRGLSLREAARLQSFPDNFIFKGTLSFQQQQVGNAVPPLLAKVIFKKILEYNI
ncbi:DNA cytosine methyltransferase [Aliarcobacter lanthieri]|uniref:DNA cytosine methyltransferase n=1 Tax=Aliarcobacter lanthieri TaxID=1355374 RepID=UPI0004ACCE32|nr:DNA cytosine methyltransferase [Aliarcobacter lanthieri]